ncbi:MAG TPA: Asp-tRNA(Asn)/Glu-tRNA(Gln) amidotransferase GatCAB subunit A, partial [Bacteroidetes bacterium]|nr:Asp-tRNA(Asn)/Glu-tRNA(Gln) amidotransferase GatCAB subunit A [Bacteroidota bacterium]
IEKKKNLNAFLEVFADEAREQAILIDKKISEGKAGRLAGMVIAIKDVLCYKGHKVSSSSKILSGFTSLYSATAVQRLINEDAIIIGRTNCDEFAMGSSNENSAYGNVKNGLDETKVPGGSSGGSAVAVQMDMCLASLGTDTGGSIRQPASFCGVIGMKPTYGRISRYGLIAYASSFDQIGPFTHSIEDAALMLEVMSGADDYDSTTSSTTVEKYSEKLAFNRKAKIAVFSSCVNHEGIDTEVRKKILDYIEELKSKGHTIEMIDFPYLDYLVPAYYVLTTAEASSNLARFDGIRFGYKSEKATDLDTTYKRNRTEGFGPEVKRRIMLGTFVLSAGYYDAYYTKGQKVRRLIKEKTEEILSRFDFILTPTTPTTAFNIGEKADDPIAMYLADIFTVQAPIAGIPAITLPLFTHSNGLPFGMQIMAGKFKEADMLAFSKELTGE